MNRNLEKLIKELSAEEILVLQNQQIEKLNYAKNKIDNGELDEGIGIIEKIVYEEGGFIFNGRTWTFYLAEVLLKNKLYDKCRKYLDVISISNPDDLDRIRKLQAKVSLQIEKPIEALCLIIVSIFYQFKNTNYIPSNAELQNMIKPYRKKVKLGFEDQILYGYIKRYLTEKSITELEIIDDIINLTKY